MFFVPLLACVLSLQDVAKPITVVPGLHSYKQLAAELSASGLTVRCDPSVANRYALIRIPAKPWDSLRPLLETALEIRFATTSEGAIELQANKKVMALEGTLLHRFARKYDQTFQSAVREGWDLHNDIHADSDPGVIFAKLHESAASTETLPPWDSRRNAYLVAEKVEDFQARLSYAELWDGIDLVKLLKRASTSLLAENDFNNWLPPDNPIGRTLPDAKSLFGEPTFTGVWDHIVTSSEPVSFPHTAIETWSIDPKLLQIRRTHSSSLDLQSSATYDSVFPAITIEESLEDLYKGLPELTAMRQRRSSTEDWLKSDAAGATVVTKGTPESVSALFDQWSQKANAPIVMEISPARNSILKVTDDTTEMTVSPKAFIEAEESEDLHPSLLKTPWSIGVIDGVTIVKDELDFIDHLVQPNPAAEVYLKQVSNQSQDHLVSVEDLLHASELLTSAENAEACMRGVYEKWDAFSFAYPYLRLISSSETAKASYLKLREGQNVEIPFSQFSIEARHQFLKSVQDLVTAGPAFTDTISPRLWIGSLDSDFMDALDKSTLRVEFTVYKSHVHLLFGISDSPLSWGPSLLGVSLLLALSGIRLPS